MLYRKGTLRIAGDEAFFTDGPRLWVLKAVVAQDEPNLYRAAVESAPDGVPPGPGAAVVLDLRGPDPEMGWIE